MIGDDCILLITAAVQGRRLLPSRPIVPELLQTPLRPSGTMASLSRQISGFRLSSAGQARALLATFQTSTRSRPWREVPDMDKEVSIRWFAAEVRTVLFA